MFAEAKRRHRQKLAIQQIEKLREQQKVRGEEEEEEEQEAEQETEEYQHSQESEKGVEQFVQSINPDIVTEALASCVNELDKAEQKKLISIFLVDQINHYNLQQERIVIVTKDSLIRIKYDFTNLCVLKKSIVPFQAIKAIHFGTIYVSSKISTNTPMNPMNDFNGETGIKIVTQHEEPSFFQLWNPIVSNPPCYIYTTHSPTKHYGNLAEYHSISLFCESLKKAVYAFDSLVTEGDESKFIETEILVDAGLGLCNYIYNGFELGRTVDRSLMIKHEKEKLSLIATQITKLALEKTQESIEIAKRRQQREIYEERKRMEREEKKRMERAERRRLEKLERNRREKDQTRGEYYENDEEEQYDENEEEEEQYERQKQEEHYEEYEMRQRRYEGRTIKKRGQSFEQEFFQE